MLARYYLAAKRKLRILSDRVIVATHRPPRERPSDTLLITAHTHKAHLKKNHVSLGCWANPPPRLPIRSVRWDTGYLLIHEKDGTLQLVKVEVE